MVLGLNMVTCFDHDKILHHFRVKYREDQMQLKMEERERMREEKLADELERERRLEVLREQVLV